MNQDHSKFIESIVDDLTEQKSIFSPEKRTLLFLPIYVGSIALIMYMIAPYRENFISDFQSIHFLFEFLSGIICFGLLIYSSYLSVVPGALKKRNHIVFLLLVLFYSFVVLMSFSSPALTPSMDGKRATCVFEVLFLSILPLAHLIFLLKRGVFYYKSNITFYAGLACALIPAVIMNIACMYDPIHNFKFHFMPVFIVGAIAALIIKKARL